MENNLAEAAYKPAEKLLFNYLEIFHLLDRVLREQKLPPDVYKLLLQVYSNFKANMNTVIKLYKKLPNTLALAEFTMDIYMDGDLLLSAINLDEPLIDSSIMMTRLAELLKAIDKHLLAPSEKIKDAIPGFTWDFESFRKVFKQIIGKGAK